MPAIRPQRSHSQGGSCCACAGPSEGVNEPLAPPDGGIFCATCPATMVRLSGENPETLLQICSDPKTASTISCTLWYRSAGFLAIALRITDLNGSSMALTSGSALRCFMRISVGDAPKNGT